LFVYFFQIIEIAQLPGRALNFDNTNRNLASLPVESNFGVRKWRK
jgi:hypothetical protein